MIAPRAMRIGLLGLVVVVGIVLIGAAHDLSRHNALIAFANYRPEWEDARRAPVEHLAVEVLGREIAHPEQDQQLTQAALAVLRHSFSWVAMAPGICSQLKGWLDVRLEKKNVDADNLKAAYDLLVLAESEDSDTYKARIAALAGDRLTRANALSKQAEVLAAQTATGNIDDPEPLEHVANAWQALFATVDGKPINSLALDQPDVIEAQNEASTAVKDRLMAALKPYLVKTSVSYGETQPDEGILAWLDKQAIVINTDSPVHQERVRRARAVLAQFAPDYHIEPYPEAACTSALRYHHLTTAGLLIGLFVTAALLAGLWFSLVRLARGPQPVDVDAETMENVEPIDLDTDAETRIRSSPNITDVG